MCNLSKGVLEKGMALGMEQAYMSSIKNIMEALGLSAVQTMAVLKIPEDEQQKYIDMLEKDSCRPQA